MTDADVIQDPLDTTPEWRKFWDQPPEPEALRDWKIGLTPGLIAAALWLPWLDLPAQRSLAYGDLLTVLAGVWAGAWAVLPLFFAAMSLVRRQNQPLRAIVAGAFGSRVGPVLVLATHGLAAFFVLTVSIDLAAEWYFRTLAGFGLLETPPPTVIRYLTTSVWALWIIPIGYGMVRIMAALVDHVSVLIAGVLSVAFVNLLFFSDDPRTLALDPTLVDSGRAFREAFGATFGFAAVCSLFACEWGIGLKSRRDGIIGGILGLGLAVPIVGTIGIVAISVGSETIGAGSIYDLVAALGRWPALVFGLLVGTWVAAPGVFASFHLLQDLRQVWPRVYHQRWMIVTIVVMQFAIAGGVREGLMNGAALIAGAVLATATILRMVVRSPSGDTAIPPLA
jgi:hypothetical protein